MMFTINSNCLYFFIISANVRSILLAVVFVLGFIYVYKLKKIYRTFHEMGLPGPPPRFFFGNAIELFTHRQHSAACLADWTKLYGKVYGYFIGHTPVICISDPDLLQEIFITKFSHFHSRRPLPLQQHDLRHLLAATDDEWRRQRAIIQPTFSPNKLKEMRTIIESCLDGLMEKLDEQPTETEFDITGVIQRTSMDIILNCAFGLRSDMSSILTDSYFRRCMQVFQFGFFQTCLTICSILVPEFNLIWVGFFKYTNIIRLWLCDHLPLMHRLIDTDPNTWLLHHVGQLIEQRCLHPVNRVDLLQSMIEATDVSPPSSPTSTVPKNRLKHDELLNNIYLFMLGGYETTATTLSYLAYVLATHPAEQARLQHEIDQVHDDYEQIIKLNYLDWFIRETLRMYPIAPFIVNRQCNRACHIGPLAVDVGTNFSVDMFSIHYDEQLYGGPVSPLKFYPERFKNKHHPLAWLPFGAGPRNCIGMRFALLEIKLALVRILRRYTILSGEHTVSQFSEHERFVIGPKNGIWVRVQRRENVA